MRRNLLQAAMPSLLPSFVGIGIGIGIALCSPAALAQRPLIGNWTAAGNDPAHSGWQKSEKVLTADNAAAKFKFLWKLKLGPEPKDGGSFNEPLLAPRLINAQGFKDIVFSGSSDTLYAVDSELGVLLWKKPFEAQSAANGPCNDVGLKMVMEPPQVINFAARRAPAPAPGAAPAPPPPPPPPPPSASARRLGVPGGGGGFALRAIYILTSDGTLHGQVLTTGADYGPPVKFLPAASNGAAGLNVIGTLGTLLTAKRTGLLKSIRPELDATVCHTDCLGGRSSGG